MSEVGDVTVKVNFMGELRSLLKRRNLDVALTDGATVGSLVDRLCQELGPSFQGQVLRQDGALLPHVSIFVNGEDIKGQAGLETRLSSGEVDVLILPTYGGG